MADINRLYWLRWSWTWNLLKHCMVFVERFEIAWCKTSTLLHKLLRNLVRNITLIILYLRSFQICFWRFFVLLASLISGFMPLLIFQCLIWNWLYGYIPLNFLCQIGVSFFLWFKLLELVRLNSLKFFIILISLYFHRRNSLTKRLVLIWCK